MPQQTGSWTCQPSIAAEGVTAVDARARWRQAVEAAYGPEYAKSGTSRMVATTCVNGACRMAAAPCVHTGA